MLAAVLLVGGDIAASHAAGADAREIDALARRQDTHAPQHVPRHDREAQGRHAGPGQKRTPRMFPVVEDPSSMGLVMVCSLLGCSLLRLAFDLDFDPVGVGEVHPVPLPTGLQPGGLQCLLGLFGVIALDGVAVVVQAGMLTFEQRQEEAPFAAEEAVVLAILP